MSAQTFTERREHFPYRMVIPTRWNDNDMLGHVNNVIYYSYFEAAVVRFVQEETKTDWATAAHIPYALETKCRFIRPVKFPQTLEVGMRIAKLGNSSVTYDMALFAEGTDEPAATSQWIHVWVDREEERPIPIPDAIRAAYQSFT